MPHILAFGKRFFNQTHLKNVVPFDAASFVGKINVFMEDPDAAIFILGDEPCGVIAGMVYDTWFNSDAKAGQDLFWWIEPEHRSFQSANGMIGALENWARNRGATWFTMAATETMRPDGLEKWYRRKGYEMSERHFIRNL